ncbi:MAG: hypothetical protein AB9866_04445 [Syntrophobacteraceae bacterium]
MGNEKRRRRRFQGGGEAFAAFIRPNEPIVVGKVVDMSSGGLGVRYLAEGEVGEGFSHVTIFVPNSTKVERIRSTVVYDMEITEESFKSQPVRRCGIKFDLPLNKNMLQYFVEKHPGKELISGFA